MCYERKIQVTHDVHLCIINVTPEKMWNVVGTEGLRPISYGDLNTIEAYPKALHKTVRPKNWKEYEGWNL